MTVNRLTLIECDNCHQRVGLPGPAPNKGFLEPAEDEVRKHFHRHGWTLDAGGRDLCTDCSSSI